jgi:hypothetical protein
MSTKVAATALLLLVTACAGQTASSGPNALTAGSSPPSVPSRTPDPVPSVVGSSPTLEPSRSPSPVESVLPPEPAPRVTPKPTPKPKLTPKPYTPKFTGRTVVGIASTYGSSAYNGLFALPRTLGGRGERVRICSVDTHVCLVRTSNDVGPVARLHRVADVDGPTFNTLCRCRWQTKGVMKVSITWLR